MRTESSSLTEEYEYQKLMFEQFGETEGVTEFLERIMDKARIIEYCLTGTIRERVNDVLFELLTYGKIKERRLGVICRRMQWFKDSIRDFFGLELRQDGCYYPTVDCLRKVMVYGTENE